jgi:lauroyl/myristoyl acyltransferase
MTTAEQPWEARVAARPLVRVKDLAWLVYLYPARWLAYLLPIRANHALWDALAWLGAACLRGPRRRLAARLRLAFPAPAAGPSIDRIATDYFRNAIVRFGDDLLLPRLAREGGLKHVDVVHPEHLTSALAAGKGAMLVSAHFMASRAARQHIAASGHSTASVRHLAPQDASAGRLGVQFVQRRYIEFLSRVIGDEIPVRDPDCSLRMMARLRSGGLIDLHVDAAFSREVVRREFLGVSYPFGAGAFHLAWIVGAPLVPLQSLGNSRQLCIEFGEPIRPERWADRNAFAAAALDRILPILERQIRASPAQWDLWIRW